jgi:anti-sigma factor RsiW
MSAQGHEEGLQLSAYLDGELSADETALLKSHLDACPACRVELEGLRAAKHWLSAAPRRAMPPELIADLSERFARPSWGERLSAWMPRPQVWIPAGAVAALLLGSGVWLHWRNADPDQYVPLEPLLAAHSRYEAESLVPQTSLVASSYSSQLTAEYADAQDKETE